MLCEYACQGCVVSECCVMLGPNVVYVCVRVARGNRNK